MSLFHERAAGPISTKFCTDLTTNVGKVLNTSLTLPTQPPDPWVLQALKPKQIHWIKTLLYKKCIKFFPASGEPRVYQNFDLQIGKDITKYVNRMNDLESKLHKLSPNLDEAETQLQKTSFECEKHKKEIMELKQEVLQSLLKND